MNITEKFFELVTGRRLMYKRFIKQLGYIDPTAHIDMPDTCSCPSKIFLYKNAIVRNHARFIITKHGDFGKFIMKENSGAAVGLTVVSGNHSSNRIGESVVTAGTFYDVDKDVVVEEDVWIASNVTLLAGVTVGRGAVVGAGSVVRASIPPYSVVLGNPCKVIGYRFKPQEIIQHEMLLYPEEKRLPLKLLEKNYNKYFDNRERIADYLNLY